MKSRLNSAVWHYEQGCSVSSVKSVPFWHKWRISAPGIVFHNPGIIDLWRFRIRLATRLLLIIPRDGSALITSLYIDMDDFSLFLPNVQAYATLMIVRLRPTRFLSLLPASYGQKATIALFRWKYTPRKWYSFLKGWFPVITFYKINPSSLFRSPTGKRTETGNHRK